MPRAKGGYKSRHRRNKIRKAAKGFRLKRSKLYRYAADALDHGPLRGRKAGHFRSRAARAAPRSRLP